MPFDVNAGQERFQTNMDEEFNDFDVYCTTEQIARDMWAEVFYELTTTMSPASSTGIAAREGMRTALNGLSIPATGLAVLVAAANGFCATLATGIPNTTSILPVFIPFDFGDPSLNVPGITQQQTCVLMTSKIVARLSTGSSFILPVGPTVPWT